MSSSGVFTIQIPNLSFHRSSTPMPYSVGNPALNCCGGSLSTFGNMKRPVAASAAADAAENAPHASPSQARRVSSGDRSSGSRVAGLAAGADVVALAADPPADATVVVRPARSGIGAAGGLGAAGGRAAGGFAPVAAAAAAVAGASPPGTIFCGGVAAGFVPVGGAPGSIVSGFLSSAILVHQLQRFDCSLTHLHAPILLTERRDRILERFVLQ